MTLSKIDSNLIYAGAHAEVELGKKPIPAGWIAADPPPGPGVWQWAGDRWAKLEQYPSIPPQHAVAPKTKDQLKAEYQAAGMLDALNALIDERIAAKSPKV